MNSMHALLIKFFKIHFNIILPFFSVLCFHASLSSLLRLGLPRSLFPSDFPIRTMYTFLPHAYHMSCHAVSCEMKKTNPLWTKSPQKQWFGTNVRRDLGVIHRSYTRFSLSRDQTSMLWNLLNCTMEFLDNGATYNTSLVSKMTYLIVLKTRIFFNICGSEHHAL